MCANRDPSHIQQNKPWFTAELTQLHQPWIHWQKRSRWLRKNYTKKWKNRFPAKNAESDWRGLQDITNYRRPSSSAGKNIELVDSKQILLHIGKTQPHTPITSGKWWSWLCRKTSLKHTNNVQAVDTCVSRHGPCWYLHGLKKDVTVLWDGQLKNTTKTSSVLILYQQPAQHKLQYLYCSTVLVV